MAKRTLIGEQAEQEPPNPRSARGPIKRPVPLRQVVCDALVEMIISQELAPGEHLREGELTQVLGVSRQPIREALQQLQGEGWVDLRPGHGAFVHVPTEKEEDDLLRVRTLLESEAARLAAATRTAEDVVELQRLMKEGRKAVSAKDNEAIVSANARLHGYIMQIVNNDVLTGLSRSVERRVRWYHTSIVQMRADESWDEHARIIGAIADGDEQRAAQLMAAHTEWTRRVTHDLARISAHADAFSAVRHT